MKRRKGPVESRLADEWHRLRNSRRRRLGTAAVLLVITAGLLSAVGWLSATPAHYVEAVGVVRDVRADQTTNSESGRITTLWTKEIRVTDIVNRTWTFLYRDGIQYRIGDAIGVLYDPADPVGTLVAEDHDFNWIPSFSLFLVAMVAFVLLVAVIGLSAWTGIQAHRNRP